MGIGTSTMAVIHGRKMGKSIMQQMMQSQAAALQKAIDQDIIDSIWNMAQYHIHKTWHNRRGQKMHRIRASHKIREWLATEYNQQGAANPEWWLLGEQINITDRMLTVLILKWS